MSAFSFSRSIMPKAAVACTFDVATKKGQTVEVIYNPHNLNLSNVEYQSLPVGGHHLASDIILFTVSHSASTVMQSTIYPCLALFSRAKLPSSAKPAFRGYSMKSISLVFPPHTTVQYMYLYKKSLEDKVAEMHEWDLCENNERDAKKSSMKSWMMSLVVAEREFQDPITSEIGENEAISNGLEQLMSTMSSNLIVLWKCLALGKRVLFLSNAENQFKYLNGIASPSHYLPQKIG
ncbi:hypothetical protein BKA69DRAFT_1056345 [Paraphysoderma sedebokerense]|nr:hypothetical protein BKA69DRAFT_1056345 [Paraphysoderma sedebokerense]